MITFPAKRQPPHLTRVMRIVHEHLLHGELHAKQIATIAKRLKITTLSAISLAVADQVCEEFTLTLND